MIMVRELTDEEITNIENMHTEIHTHNTGEYDFDFSAIDAIGFARALFEAARVQQTTERTNDKG